MKYLIPILFLLTSCSQSFYCKRCESMGGLKSDTVFTNLKIKEEGKKADSLLDFSRPVTESDSLEWMNWSGIVPRDTIVITKDSITVKIKFLPGKKIFVQGSTKTVYKTRKVPTYITKTITVKEGYPKLWTWVIGTAAVFLALLLGAVGSRIVSIFGRR